jgi:archaellum component FlaG (FlaF/FlaG flagellin family)
MVQPQSQIVRWGEPITLRVEAIGTKPILYQWRLNGMDIPNATNATFIQEKAREVDSGMYMVVVSNVFGATNSAIAYVPIVLSPNIVEQPRSQTVAENTSVTFWIKATGIEPITYQWRYQGVELPGETQAAFTLTNVTAAHNGLYQVEVKNEGGTVLSSSALLTVTSNPQVLNMQISAGTATLTLKTQPGKQYVIQQSPDMLVWVNAGSFTAESTTTEFKMPVSDKKMFYRIKMD